MRIVSISNTSVSGQNTLQNNHSKMSINQNYSSFNTSKTHNPSFGWFGVDDLFYYGNRKLNESREAERRIERERVNQKVLNDIEFMAKRLRIPKDAAIERYNESLKIGGIEPNKNGYEVGLNKVIGYSAEKLDLIKDFVAPIITYHTAIEKGQTPPDDIKLPNGVVFYGPTGNGKSYFIENLKEHFDEKKKKDYLRIQTVELDRPWAEGDTKENLDAIFKIADSAFDYSYNTPAHTIVFINGLQHLLDEEKNPKLCAAFYTLAALGGENGLSWAGTIDDPRNVPEWLFDPMLTSKEIGLKGISDVEQSALMSYFWAQKDRKDNTDHAKLLDYMQSEGLRISPPDFKRISEIVDRKLKQEKDYDSEKRGRYRAPVTTKDVIAGIQQYNADNKGILTGKIPDGLTDEEYIAVVKSKGAGNDKQAE